MAYQYECECGYESQVIHSYIAATFSKNAHEDVCGHEATMNELGLSLGAKKI